MYRSIGCHKVLPVVLTYLLNISMMGMHSDVLVLLYSCYVVIGFIGCLALNYVFGIVLIVSL